MDIENRPKGGAPRLDAALTTKSKSLCRSKSCSACFILSLICTYLATLIVLLDQTVVEAVSYGQHDSNRSEAYTILFDSDKSFRLPEEVVPIHYDLYLHPKLKEGTFSGKVTILIDVKQNYNRRFIALHQKNLNVKSAKLTYDLDENYEINISYINKPSKYEIFTILTENEIKSGLYHLSLEFDGSLKDKMDGFYSSTYQYTSDNINETRYIGTTQFEPTYARQAFPCFDEPHLKAEFSIKLVYPMDNGYHALSNMNVKSTEIHTPKRNLATVTFAKTVRMSTYLVAFVISDFVGTSKMAKGLNGREFPVSVYTTRLQSKEKRDFAVDIGVKAIEYFINLFKIDYQLPKLDMVGIPDFKAGAMENWGIVTYREARLIYDDHSNSIYDKRAVINVICHELAHMWFGNLVTINWWNDLWLNEGFATFMSFKCSDAIVPNQQYMEEFPISIMQNVFVSDSKLSSHPIVYNVQNAADIAAFFDDVSYQKGSSIIRMMENFFGSDVFFGAINSYLNKYSYENAETADLFEVLQNAVGNKLNVTAVMDTWTRQEGFPVINVKKSENKFVLTQKRFLDDQDAKFDPSESNYRYRWTIPITYITNRNKKPTLVWFNRNANKLVIKVDRRTKWIKLNAGQVGFYQVNYKKEWKTFKELLRSCHTKISSLDRANLLGDMFSLADAGEIEYNTVMDINVYLIKESHAFPWKVAKSKLMTMHALLTSSSKPHIADKFQSFVLMLVDTVYKNVAWIDKTTEDVPLTYMNRILRPTVIELACAMDSPECLKTVGELFKEWLIEEKPQHPDIRELVYYYGMRYRSDENEWNIMFEKFKDETDPSEKNKIMIGLSGIKSTKVLKEYITRATNETYVRTQDFLRCLTMISMNPDGTSLVWNWVRENWEFLVNRYTLNDPYLGRLIPSITRSFATQSRLDEIKAFFKKYPKAGAEWTQFIINREVFLIIFFISCVRRILLKNIELHYSVFLCCIPIMGNNKVESRPKGGALRLDATISKPLCSNNTVSALLCFTCGACFILSLICTCLAILVVLLDQTVEATSYSRHDSNRPEAYTIMFDPDESFRLPKEVVPIHYDLYLHPKLKESTFSGKVTILIDVKQDNNRTSIALHQKDLNITSVKLITYGLDEDYEINISSISKPTKYEIFMITTENNIKSGLYNLSLEFDGSLKDKIVGFYNSKYQYKSDKINEIRYIATTKFEPTYARQAFPCFDEPNFKAEFSIKLVHPMNDCYSALSNMDVKSTQLHTPERDLATVTFTKTVPMSTYLACFIISDFVGTSRMANGLNDRKFPLTVYTTRLQSKEKRDFALDIGVKAVEYYINLFKIDYPLPKLVTMKWWNDLWLNEGFATFMASKCSDAILPHQGYMEEFPVEVMQKVFVPDSKLSSHPIIYNVQNADDITSFFDGISYKKGASIIRMMENFFGSDVFFSAISIYLNKYAYENAETADLFEVLQDAVGNKLNVTAIMDTWTRQEGFPVVNVKKSGNNYTLTQKRFLDDQDAKSDPSKSSYGYRWTIPIVYITNRNEVPTLVWFDKDANEVVIEVDERTKWFKLNAGQVGFYRVNYNEEWETLNELLRSHHTRISMLDRANLLDDLFSLAEAGEIEYDTVLNITMYLTEEYHCLPWAVAKSKLMTIYTLLTSSADPFISSTFQSFVWILVDTIYKDVTWTVDDAIEEDVPRIDNKVRPIVIELACAMALPACLKKASELFNEWLIEEKPQHPDVRELVYYYGMRYYSDAIEWSVMFERFKNETDPGEKNKIMAGLTGTQSIRVLKEFIIIATDERFVRAQDFLKCLIMISKNPDGTSLVWDWVRENWEFLVNRYTLNDRYLGDLIPSITSSFATQTKLDEIKAFFKKYPEAGAGADGRAKTLETVSKNIKWLAKNTKKFDKWFSENWPFKTR
ncbi:Glutamyl aminopeptidase [Acromyrmex echinatior]|uniref:glutamyl aminopeptidase n=1 Tax=Acromyrmex echinatior TaxID=103372 RepID=F4W5B0_ACREC|nr:Glutamyl aminopeptidase [Acromyrmex echinatior]